MRGKQEILFLFVNCVCLTTNNLSLNRNLKDAYSMTNLIISYGMAYLLI